MTDKTTAMPEHVWLIYAKKKPELRRLSFSPRLSAEEKGSGWVAEPYALAALQSQPAEVSDADIYALWVKHCETPGTTTRQLVRAFARAILALRPQAVPMTDEQIESLLVNWPKDGIAFFDFARAIEAHHGITAQGAQGEQG